MANVEYGDVFNGLVQSIAVNVCAKHVDPEKWEPVENVVVAPGKKWYYATVKHRDDTVSGPYLIRDKVLSDGWGEIRVYKDIEIIGNRPDYSLRVRNEVQW